MWDNVFLENDGFLFIDFYNEEPVCDKCGNSFPRMATIEFDSGKFCLKCSADNGMIHPIDKEWKMLNRIEIEGRIEFHKKKIKELRNELRISEQSAS